MIRFVSNDFKAGVLKVNIPRNDLKMTIQGFSTPTPFGFGGWIALTKATDGSEVMMGDLVLLQEEVNPVLSALLDNGIDVTALHNHFFWDDPHVYYMHVHGMGKASDLARRVKPGLDLIGHVKPETTAPASSSGTALDTAKLTKIAGHEGEQTGAVYKITVGRDDLGMKEHGAVINARMGLNTWAAFVGTQEDAAIAGDVAMLEDSRADSRPLSMNSAKALLLVAARTRAIPSAQVMTRNPESRERTSTQPTLRELVLYFLRLGALGFGGPIALVGYMQRDLVENRKWVSKEDYFEGLAFSQLCPGPLAAQLAKYLGWVHSGTLGATLTGAAFIFPSFLMVLGLASLYVHFGQLAWIQGLFYGIGAAVSAIIVRSAWKLIQKTLGRDYLLWVLFGALAITTVWTQSEVVWLFILSGFVAMLVKAPPKLKARAVQAGIIGPGLVTGLLGAASSGTVVSVFLFFLKAGAFVFGSGLAIVPFLYGGVVGQFHWLTERQFLDAVAVAMITPGPIVITSGFIGYLVAGPLGACAAALAVFLPPYLLVIFAAPYYRRFAQNRQVKAFVQGVTAAAVGAIAGAAVILSRRALVDVPTVLMALISFGVLLGFKRVPEPLLILAAGVAGVVLHHGS